MQLLNDKPDIFGRIFPYFVSYDSAQQDIDGWSTRGFTKILVSTKGKLRLARFLYKLLKLCIRALYLMIKLLFTL